MEKGASHEQRRDAVWVVLVWGRVAAGLTLAALGGVVFGHAWTRDYAPLWWVGAMTVLAGALLVLSGLYARSRPSDLKPRTAVRGDAFHEQEPLVPLLGALLVYKYQWVTQEQLSQALAQQHAEKEKKRRLGEILVALGAVTEPQLEEALAHQRSVLHES